MTHQLYLKLYLKENVSPKMYIGKKENVKINDHPKKVKSSKIKPRKIKGNNNKNNKYKSKKFIK